MHAVRAHRRDVGRREDAAFGDHQPAGRNARQQVERGRERHVEGAQVAVVDADERRREPQRALELGGVVHLDQHRHAEVARAGFERGEARVVERGDDQQDRVGAQRARLGDLVLVDDEVLAQRRQRAGGARRGQDTRARPGRYARSVSTDRQAAPPAS